MRFLSPVCLVLLLLANRVTAAAEEISTLTLQRLEQDRVARINGNIRIKGTILDDRGMPLDGVKVSVFVNTVTGFMRDKSVERQFVANGQFQVEYEGCTVISLDFERQGYHKEWGHVYEFERPLARVNIKNGWQVYDKEVVVLREIGDLGQIEKYEFRYRGQTWKDAL